VGIVSPSQIHRRKREKGEHRRNSKLANRRTNHGETGREKVLRIFSRREKRRFSIEKVYSLGLRPKEEESKQNEGMEELLADLNLGETLSKEGNEKWCCIGLVEKLSGIAERKERLLKTAHGACGGQEGNK